MADSVTAKERMGGFLKPSTAHAAPPEAAPAPAARAQARGGDPVQSIGVGLRKSEAAELASIAAGLGVPRSGLMAWVLRRFLEDYRAGRVTLPPLETVTTTRLPRD
jgi:hypothetical protein